MKKRFNLKNLTGRKNVLLTVVALILVMILVVGVSYSWIEQISNVEFQFPSGVENPMHISTDRLNQTAEAELNGRTPKVIDLSRYFYESGNMHLSSCYSDGNSFYFPTPTKNQTGKSTGTTYRLGTKDDANVNYISVSFKITNKEAYDQVYWFDKSSTFFKTKSSADSSLDKLIRCSMTVDGSTSIFSASDTPAYKTIDSITDSTPKSNSCQSFKAYQYDPDHNHQDDSSNTNLSPTRGANGNVLFTLAAGRTSTVNIKVWLEYDDSNRSASLSDINMKLVSSFTKTRNIYLTDQSVYNKLDPNSTWMYTAGDGHADMYLVLKDDTTKYWKFTETSLNDHKHFVVQNFPSYYNNKDVYILRCNSTGFGTGDNDKVIPGTTIHYWNKWDTKLPDTYDDRTFSVYSPGFGSWRNTDKIGYFYLIDSWDWGKNDSLTYNGVYVYMWDNTTVADGVKTVENHAWENGAHGEPMFYTNKRVGGDGTPRIYVVYYDADFTHVIFNNNDNYQTSDLEIEKGKFYDLTSNRWIDDYANAAYTKSQTSAYGTFDGGTNYVERTLYSAANGGNYLYGATYLKANTKYEMQIKDTVNNGDIRYSDRNNATMNSTSEWELVENNQKKVYIQTGSAGIYWFRWDWSTHKFKVTFPFKAAKGSGGSSSSSGDSSGSMDGYTTDSEFTVQLSGQTYTVKTNSTGTSFKVKIPLAVGDNWTTFQKKGTNYGLDSSGQHYDVPKAGLSIYLVKGKNYNISLKNTSTAGDYIVSFEYDSGNTNTTKITSVLAASS